MDMQVKEEVEKCVDLEHEIGKSSFMEVLRDAHEKHELQIQKILKQLHAEHEKSLESIVTGAVRQAMAEAAPASTEAVVLPVAGVETSNSFFAPDVSKKEKTQSHPDELLTRHLTTSLEPTRNQGSLEQNVKDVNRKVGSVVTLARADSFDKDSSGWSATLEKIMSHPMFDYFTAMFIFANAVLIAIQTEMAAQDAKAEQPPAFKAIDLFFTIFFTIELTMRIIVEKHRFILGRNRGWNVFDSFVVGSAIMEEFLSASTNTTAIRVLRIMRLVRVIRVIRTLRMFNDLRAMVSGIFASLLSLVWALVLLFVIFFVIGIFITQVVTSYRRDNAPDAELDELLQDNFGSLGHTIYSLYKAITGGDDWSSFADPLFEVGTPMGFFFCFYIAFAVLAVLNVVTGVFVDNAIKANSQDADMIILEQTEARQKHIQEIKSIFKKADTDRSDKLDWDEFRTHIGNPYVQAYFRQLDLDIEGNGAQALFSLLDFDGNGTVDIEEFIFGCGQMKGYARSIDLHRLRHGQREISHRLLEIGNEQNHRLDTMQGNFSMLLAHLGLQAPRPIQQPLHKKLDDITAPQQKSPAPPACKGAPVKATSPVAPVKQPPAPEGQPPGLPGAVHVEDAPGLSFSSIN